MSILKVFDNIIEKPLQEEIKSKLMKDFPWFYMDDVSSNLSSITQSRHAFYHLFYDNYNDNSDFCWMPNEIVSKVIVELKLKITQIIQSRTFLQLPLSQYLKNDTVDNAHVDSQINHLVFLYYVVDSDGDTIIYDKKWEKGIQHLNSEESKIIN